MRYHERTKHRFNRFAAGPAQLDWANQPNPFRRYEGATLTRLPRLAADGEPRLPGYESLFAHGAVASEQVDVRSLSRLLEYALALSAWKQYGAARWALRATRRAATCIPTEGYVLIGRDCPACTAGPPPLRSRASTPSSGARPSGPAATAVRRAAAAARDVPGRPRLHPLARGLEVRRAGLPLLPARRRARPGHAAVRGRGSRLVGGTARRRQVMKRSRRCWGSTDVRFEGAERETPSF